MKKERLSLKELRRKSQGSVENVPEDTIDTDKFTSPSSPTIPEIAEGTRKRKRKHPSVSKKQSSSDSTEIGELAGKSVDSIDTKKKSESILKKTTAEAESHQGDTSNLCNERTIYIEGLPYDSNEEDVTKFFESCGKIQSVRLPKWHDSGRLRGYGHVEFSTGESVKKALDLDGCDMKGRYIKVDRPQTPRALSSTVNTKENVLRPAGCRSVFLKNIPYDTSEAEVTEVFKVCGPITNVRLAVWGNTKQLKGFGYVDFKREDSAEIAVKKSGQLTLSGRPVIIDFETGAPKKSFRKPDGKIWTKSDSQFSQKPRKV